MMTLSRRFSNVAGHDALGQASTMAVLPAGLAEQHGLFFGAAREDLHAADFLVAANHRGPSYRAAPAR
jgi:hypothetical protein